MVRTWIAMGLLLGPLALVRAEPGIGPDPARLAARDELERRLGVAVRVEWDPATGCPAAVQFEPPLPLEAGEPGPAARELIRLVEPLYGRLPLVGDPGRRSPLLSPLEAPRAQGPFRELHLAELVEGRVVEGARLSVSLARLGERTLALGISGRWVPDAPPLLPGGGPEQVVLVRGDEGWVAAREALETDEAGRPVRVWRRADGSEVRRRSRAFEGGARGLVQRGARQQEVPLRDLVLDGGDGARLLTDDQGAFPGARAALPWGLLGRFERVLPRGEGYPATTDGALRLVFPAGDPRRVEVSAFHHAVEARRSYATMWPGSETQVLLVVARGGKGNGFASAGPLEVEGRRYDAVISLDSDLALDGSLVAHERAHCLLFGLGFDVDWSADVLAIHEALADYLAAVHGGDPVIGAAGLGEARRDLRDDRLFPDHTDLNPHKTGLILAGALWDARAELGERAARLDRAALWAASGFGPSTTLPAAARAISLRAQLDAREVGPVLDRHLRAHGLLPGDDVGPPFLDLRQGQEPCHRAQVEAGTELALEVITRPGRGGAAGALRLLVDAPPFVRREGTRLVLAPRDAEAGAHLMTLTLQDGRTGAKAVRTVPLTVRPSGAPAARRGEHRLTLAAGEARRVALRQLFPPLGAGPAAALPYRFLLCGLPSLGATVAGQELLLAAEPGDEGTHRFLVQAEPADRTRDGGRLQTCALTVVVGDASLELAVFQADTDARELRRVPPGRAVVIGAGGEAAFLIDLPEGASGQLELEPTPAGLEASLGPVPASPRPYLPDESVRMGSDDRWLRLRVGPDAPSALRPLRLRLRRGNEVIATRTLPVVLLPAGPGAARGLTGALGGGR